LAWFHNMTLVNYKKKRKFEKTSEPKAVVASSKKGNIYSIQEHHARNLHWDLRLEEKGVLKSFAIPKTPPRKTGLKRLAVQTEDHPVAYAFWQGEIPKGEYGGGKVKIWDRGEYKTIEKDKKKWLIEISGKKLKGKYALIHFREKNWLFFKMKKD